MFFACLVRTLRCHRGHLVWHSFIHLLRKHWSGTNHAALDSVPATGETEQHVASSQGIRELVVQTDWEKQHCSRNARASSEQAVEAPGRNACLKKHIALGVCLHFHPGFFFFLDFVFLFSLHLFKLNSPYLFIQLLLEASLDSWPVKFNICMSFSMFGLKLKNLSIVDTS